ncbi:MAG: 50S ribosomal protein L35 [Candidatus Omnitrophota bacterium]
MPKLKTRKAVKKRMTVTKKGKVKASKASRGHLLTNKSRKRKRSLKQKQVLSAKESAKVRAMLPYA